MAQQDTTPTIVEETHDEEQSSSNTTKIAAAVIGLAIGAGIAFIVKKRKKTVDLVEVVDTGEKSENAA